MHNNETFTHVLYMLIIIFPGDWNNFLHQLGLGNHLWLTFAPTF